VSASKLKVLEADLRLTRDLIAAQFRSVTALERRVVLLERAIDGTPTKRIRIEH
jgi:hypothetical protein